MTKLEEEFLKKMEERYEKNKYEPELLHHRINYLFKELSIINGNEQKLWNGCDELDKKIEKLEQRFQELCGREVLDRQAIFSEIDRLKVKVGYVDKKIDELFTKVEVINALASPCRKPHKCPVCDGKGEWLEQYGLQHKYCACCERKGVVWD